MQLTHSPSRIIHHPLPADDPRMPESTNELAGHALNGPHVSLDCGRGETLARFRAIRNAQGKTADVG